jgi:outer membrane autotransporter protein
METVTRKRLGKAVLLSLLLMNVCKEGGATEYNAAITGNETDYDSIKEVDIVSGEVKYTFTGENTVENKGSNSFQPIKVSGKTVTVAVGDKLTLIGKGTGVSPLNTGNILATGSTGSLTFTGGTLDVTDLTEYPKSNYTIHANSGASIVFDNAVTNIGEGNLTQSSMGIMVTGAASKVIFTENADSLKINSATGIYVNGGSFSFDNTEGSVLIENNPEDRKRDTGGPGIEVAGGKVDFQKGLILDNKGQSYALRAYKSGASIAVNSEGSGSVYLTGNIQAHTSGLLDLNLLTDDSYYEGAAAIVSNGQINMKLRNGAFWKVTGNSDLTRLDFGDNAVIDMEQAAGYQKLQTGTLNGDRGTFVLGADISTGQSDTVSIGSSDAKGTYNILVSEVGRRQGDDLHLLLVNDASGEHTFIASDIYRGGIYVYKTEISNENDGGIKWYLESLHNETTEDARSILQTADSMYSSWVLSSDMLQGRLDELKETRAEHGLWARINNGKLRGEAFKNNYQTYQIGYDTAFKDRDGGSMNEWLGGAAFEYAKGNMSYGNGSGEQQTAAVMLYGSKHSQSGDRVDIVLKHGQMKGDIDTFGIAADRRDYKSRATALSLEYGKRFQREQGVYLEPQAQLLVSHINGEAAVTDYGIRVESEGINSAVGRIGLEVGQKYQRSSAYIKASLLHEFGGRADTVLTLGDETLCDCRYYSGSWWELNLGGELELGKNNDLYFDVARSFGGAFQKQWQINVGVRFSF